MPTLEQQDVVDYSSDPGLSSFAIKSLLLSPLGEKYSLNFGAASFSKVRRREKKEVLRQEVIHTGDG